MRLFLLTRNWSHAVVKFTAKRLVLKFLEIDNERILLLVFEEVYEQVCHLMRQGHQIPEIKEQVLLAKPQSKDIATSHLARIRQLLGVA